MNFHLVLQKNLQNPYFFLVEIEREKKYIKNQ